MAIVGLGPAGAYAAGHLLSNAGLDVHVDAFEKLPTPWGLVRAGVAPDHPNIKTVARIYERTVEHPRFNLYGNVEIGRHITREDLLAHYHAVIYAVGTPGDRSLTIPGAGVDGNASAAAFVAWYNGHPAFADLRFDLSCRRAVIVGNGNVALDVARMLTLDPAELARTDIADHALAALARSRIEEVVVLGRRGPEQAAFTNPELRELGRLAGVDVAVNRREVDVPAEYRETDSGKTAQRNVALLAQYAERPLRGHRKRIALRFLLSPTRLLGEGRILAVELVRNRLEWDFDGSLQAHPTSAGATIAAGLVLHAIGYRGVAIPGVPFDERRGLIRHQQGRVHGADGSPTGEYVVGWAKRGPSGVIGTNKKCAMDTVRILLQDMVSGRLRTPPRDSAIAETLLRGRRPELTTLQSWRAIDEHEQARGAMAGRPRIKLTRVADMLDVVAAPGRLSA